jgi:hypothetical protein
LLDSFTGDAWAIVRHRDVIGTHPDLDRWCNIGLFSTIEPVVEQLPDDVQRPTGSVVSGLPFELAAGAELSKPRHRKHIALECWAASLAYIEPSDRHGLGSPAAFYSRISFGGAHGSPPSSIGVFFGRPRRNWYRLSSRASRRGAHFDPLLDFVEPPSDAIGTETNALRELVALFEFQQVCTGKAYPQRLEFLPANQPRQLHGIAPIRQKGAVQLHPLWAGQGIKNQIIFTCIVLQLFRAYADRVFFL